MVTYAPATMDHKPVPLFAFTNKCGSVILGQNRRKRHAVRLLHAERQPLSRQSATGRGLHQGHLCRGAVRREDRPELGLDRRAPFQPSGRQRLAAGDPGPACRRHDQASPGARRDAVAGASSAACRRGMGDARSAVGWPRRLRRRPRLRPQGVRAVPGPVRRLGRAVRRRAGDRVARLDRDRQVVAQGQVLRIQGRRDPAAAGAEAACAPTSPASRGRRWSWPRRTTGT